MSKLKELIGGFQASGVLTEESANAIVKEFDSVVRSISYTTRKPRAGEIDGRDYFFISEDEFKKKIKENVFLEYAKVFDAFYGTSKEIVEKLINNKKHVVLVIDTQGAAELRKKNIGTHIFIAPPNVETLKQRLEKRNTDSKESIEMRLSWSKVELLQESFYDYKIVNEQLDIAYQVLKAIFIAEEHRVNKKR